MNQLILTKNAIKKIIELASDKNNNNMLRISVTGGGCQGFQYNLDMDSKKKDNDIIIQEKSAIVIINTKPNIDNIGILKPDTNIIVIQVNVNNKVCPRSG